MNSLNASKAKPEGNLPPQESRLQESRIHPQGGGEYRLRFFPDPVLDCISDPVAQPLDTPALRTLAQAMIAIMQQEQGVGIAAPQVGVLQRVIVVDWSLRHENETRPDPDPSDTQADVGQAERASEPAERASEPVVLVNPCLRKKGDARESATEGCLSIPGISAEVERPASVTVDYSTLDGQPATVTATGMLARCLQHEIDHLDGVLFWRHCSRLRRQRLIRQYQQQQPEPTAASQEPDRSRPETHD